MSWRTLAVWNRSEKREMGEGRVVEKEDGMREE